ncbi:hypothetical protein M514_12101 [Trichuris suis]|uniref:PDZ domain-containing protein n=1 Tax=Trichuris suis TaxID=68888 RepID=A0A085LPX3_9BILA|nr:hypothetical protein M513_12101 [Trichuris suis]KFD61032.1 hypothetical protein M514_12101 [Trichuris suis]
MGSQQAANAVLERIVLNINVRKDKRCFGLGIKMKKGKVFVSSIRPGSIAEDHFRLYDVIKEVNGSKVDSRESCRDLIRAHKVLAVTVERLSSKSVEQLKQARVQSSSECPYLETAKLFSEIEQNQWSKLPFDVREILKKQFATATQYGLQRPPPIEQSTKIELNRVSVLDNIVRYEINSDVPRDKSLRRPTG